MSHRVCLVTGAARGIGRAIAERLASDGWSVVLSDIDERRLHVSADEIGAGALAMTADVSDSADVRRLFSGVRQRFEHLHGLVNSAAISRPTTLADTTDASWREVLAVNLDGLYWCCREAFPLLRDSGGGAIVNLSSVSSFTGRVLNANLAYVASKGAVNALTRALAVEGLPANITVNAVAPGIVSTEIHAHMPDERQNLLPSLVPQGRLASAAEIASTIAFLLSPAARHITGQVIHQNGGMYLG
ncbi:MAG: SDR family oxidoreductase [Luteitalea sp.]|nr:SDR family oxidoreductase [Luteitalea sp.]